MQFGELLDDRKPQAQSAVLARGRCIGLAEALEDVREKLRRDAHAGVADADLHVRFDALHEQLDASALGCEFDGVGEQVPDDLLKPARVVAHQARGSVDGGDH